MVYEYDWIIEQVAVVSSFYIFSLSVYYKPPNKFFAACRNNFNNFHSLLANERTQASYPLKS